MIRLIQIEFKKFVRRKKFLTALLLLIGCCIFSIGTAAVTAPKYRGVQNEIKVAKKYISTLEEQGNLEKDKGASSFVSGGYDKAANDMKSRLAMLERTADDSIPWQQRVKEDIEHSRENLKQNINLPPVVKFDELSNIMLKEYYLNNNIPYDYNEKIASFNTMPDIIRIFSTIGLLIIVGIMVLDVIAGENKPATIKLLITKPVERWKVFLSKFIVTVLVVNFIILLLELIMFIAIGFIFSFGNPSLPIVGGIKYTIAAPEYIQELKSAVVPVLSSGVLISQGTVLLKILILQTFAVTACIAFCLLCSTAIQNSSSATGLGLVLIAFNSAAIILKGNTPMKYRIKPATIMDKIQAFLFTSHYNGFSIITGTINDSLAVNFITFKFSIIVLITWIVICYAISHVIFVKKDVLA